LFTVTGVAPAEVYRALADRGVNAPAGTFYAYECAKVLGIEDKGAVRAGIGPYTTKSDVDRLLEGVAAIRR
jgi:selenocysteine lyase/cysteine desulfurase